MVAGQWPSLVRDHEGYVNSSLRRDKSQKVPWKGRLLTSIWFLRQQSPLQSPLPWKSKGRRGGLKGWFPSCTCLTTISPCVYKSHTQDNVFVVLAAISADQPLTVSPSQYDCGEPEASLAWLPPFPGKSIYTKHYHRVSLKQAPALSVFVAVL